MSFGASRIDLGAQWCHGKEGNVVHEMVEADEVLSETDVSEASFARSDGKPVDERHCKYLLNLCTSILEDGREELASYQGNIGEYLEQKYREGIEEPDFKDIDPEFATEVLEMFQKWQCAYFASNTMSDLSGYGYTKYKECPGPLLLNWKDKGFQSIIDYVTVSGFPPSSIIV
jgi:spermine oxidase